MQWILSHDGVFRGACFLLVLLIMLGWEQWRPFRQPRSGHRQRQLRHLGLLLLNTGVARVLMPILPVGAALYAQQQHWGLLAGLGQYPMLQMIIALILLDGLIYLQHVAMHHVPWLWALHRVHHADEHLDVTSGVRFHPLEILLSLAYKVLVVVLLGVPAVAVVLFEVMLNGFAMFNHSNISLPRSVDRLLRYAIVTPDMHRVHHSVLQDETNSNYGFNLSCWDRWCGTYRAQPQESPKLMSLGLFQYQGRRWQTMRALLLLPFVKSRP